MSFLPDLDWERSIPIADMSLDGLKKIFAEYDNTLNVTDFCAIRFGCRNSNFAVSTDKGKFLLRIADTSGFNNEVIAYQLVKDNINVPSLLFHTVKNRASIFIYRYIDGVSLQKVIVESNCCVRSLLEQAAGAAALIHNTPEEKTAGLAQWDLPPFEVWYEAFLDNPAARARLGKERCDRIRRLVLDRRSFIPEIDSYRSFIHCDFRPANMLVDERQQLYIVDWESACTGHSLADLGQFLRYRRFFSNADIELFERVYNAFTNRKLPGRWYELSLFRDLIKPLQLLSLNQEAPHRNSDLIKIVEETLAYWGY